MKVKSESEVAQSCPTLSDPMDCSLPGSSVHGIFQARVLESGAIAFSSGVVEWIPRHWRGLSGDYSPGSQASGLHPAMPEPRMHGWESRGAGEQC